MGGISNALKVVRLPFLVLTPTSVLLGLAAALHYSTDCSLSLAMLALVGAVTAHMSVNALNEHHDFTSGLDFNTIRTPFSGGSGALPADPLFARMARVIGVGSLLLTVAIGLYFVSLRGYLLLPLGLLGVIVVLGYSPILTRHAFLCLVAPGLGFGPLMVLGTFFVLTGSLSATAVTVSLVPFFLVSNLLLLNQFPDVEADRDAGRSNLPILLGPRRSLAVYALFLALAASSILSGIAASALPPSSLVALLVLPAGWFVIRKAYDHFDDVPRMIPALALNVAMTVLTPILLSGSLLFA